ncbi:hypothetical protein EG359_11210 [Chryseobacterium joostei]|uniref:Uncharacterized protein n=1 Tax=Chryseobacterium joostei TaxID=112234 RepID=A0A1N7IH60_9FLAO|nr:hypothetical protein [Chryseobacterium joostei]AZB00157.1 hypothetical protein EG359_11210 [Chryseobacterium joostei]SIS36291.1 hypothetical protein SAMN05421768_105163 [Chryseobacterium joostei]
MEPITLITTALTLATPFLLKTGESIAEKVGEDIWAVIKSPFTKKNIEMPININSEEEKNKLFNLIQNEIAENAQYKEELTVAIENGKQQLNSYSQQNINNNAEVQKQINIQSNTGSIQM